jgi:hypothetical protein
MSRHQIAALNPRHTVFVGWDPPLQTYFGQVYDPTKSEDENPVFWTGADPAKQHPEVSDLALAMEPYAAIDRNMRWLLVLDREYRR